MPTDEPPAEPILSDLYHPSRAVMIGGRIVGELVRQVTPRILELRAASNGPITVLIDSPGGLTTRAASLMTLLGLYDHDPVSDAARARIITLATGHAWSCAADLLFSGDVIGALPSADIHVHGHRTKDDDITEDKAHEHGAILTRRNTHTSLWLAQRMFPRMLDTLSRVSRNPDEYGAAAEMQAEELEAGDDPVLGALALLAGAIWTELPEPFEILPELGVSGVLDIRRLREACKKPDYAPPPALLATLDDLEPEDRDQGEHRLRVVHYVLAQIVEDRESPIVDAEVLLEASREIDHYADWSSPYFRNDLLFAMLDHAEIFFEGEELEEVRRAAKTDRFDAIVGKAYRRAEPFWSFTLAISRALHRGEYTLDPESAWWLGLLDVVAGTDLNRGG